MKFNLASFQILFNHISIYGLSEEEIEWMIGDGGGGRAEMVTQVGDMVVEVTECVVIGDGDGEGGTVGDGGGAEMVGDGEVAGDGGGGGGNVGRERVGRSFWRRVRGCLSERKRVCGRAVELVVNRYHGWFERYVVYEWNGVFN